LLAVVGYNTARFIVPIERTGRRLAASLRTAARVAVPASAWIGLNMAIAGGYSVGTMLLVNNYTGSSWRREGRWQYWFLEVFVQLVVVTGIVLSIPAVRRLERRAPWVFAMSLLAPLLVLRYGWIQWGDPYNFLFRTHTVAWFFVLGWAISQAHRRWQRVVMTAVAVAVVPGFFDRPQREWFIVAGLALLVWLPTVPVPAVIVRPTAALAAASMWIYLVHYQVWPPLDRALPREVAYVLTLSVGVAAWAAAGGIERRAAHALATLRSAPRRVDLDAKPRPSGPWRPRQDRPQLVPRLGSQQEAVTVGSSR
jgi:surface polysaccharide O-acyltransferase-like enzyme